MFYVKKTKGRCSSTSRMFLPIWTYLSKELLKWWIREREGISREKREGERRGENSLRVKKGVVSALEFFTKLMVFKYILSNPP